MFSPFWVCANGFFYIKVWKFWKFPFRNCRFDNRNWGRIIYFYGKLFYFILICNFAFDAGWSVMNELFCLLFTRSIQNELHFKYEKIMFQTKTYRLVFQKIDYYQLDLVDCDGLASTIIPIDTNRAVKPFSFEKKQTCALV